MTAMNRQPTVITEAERDRIEHAKKLGWRDIIYVPETKQWVGRNPTGNPFRLHIPELPKP